MPVQLISINSLGLPAKPCVYAGDYSSYLWNLPPQSLPRDAKIAYATIARLQLATYESFIPIVTNLQLGKKKKKKIRISRSKNNRSHRRVWRVLSLDLESETLLGDSISLLEIFRVKSTAIARYVHATAS